jgi:hypothetical protein
MRSRRRTWTVAGSGLIGCAVLGMLQDGLVGTPGPAALAVVTDLVYAASVILFAVGLSAAASVVHRQALGLFALFVVALWPLTNTVISPLLPTASPSDLTSATIYGYVSLVVPVAAGLIAAVQIARADVVPHPWRWAPLGVLVFHAIVWAVPQIGFAAAGPAPDVQAFAAPLSMLGMLAFLAHTLGLGILAVVLATRERPESVEVFRSV